VADIFIVGKTGAAHERRGVNQCEALSHVEARTSMSSKSTLLRTVGVNAVLAFSGAPVRATRMRIAPLNLGATLHLQDSLLEGRSRFFTEVTRIRQVLELTQSHAPLLLFDELFSGTNSDATSPRRSSSAASPRRGSRRAVDWHAFSWQAKESLTLTQMVARLLRALVC
jgi:hypothetical protein